MGMMMVTSFVIAPIAGILLALRFKVFVLVPATLLAAAVIVACSHQPKLTTALTVAATAVLLQIGYIVGVIVGALLQRRSMARSGDSFSKSIGASGTWRAVGASKKPATTKTEKRHLVQ
jgi:glycerol-3-phosphate acyltransferase PlsY